MLRRSPIRRYTPLRPGRPPRRKTRVRARRATPRDRGDYADPAYLAWLRKRPCRVPGCPHSSEAHHLRHDERGAALGARIKDDRRAISLCHACHMQLHQTPWRLRTLVQCELRAWQDAQLAIQRAEYIEHQQTGANFSIVAF